MLRNYLKVGYRALLRNKVPATINVVGLSIAIACSIVVYLFLQVYLSFDAFHENGESIFLVQHVVERDGGTEAWGTTPLPIGPAMETDFPQVNRAIRFDRLPGTVRRGPDAYNTLISFADAGFFRTFTFPLKAGSPDALAEPDAVILSQEAANRYFGEADPMGRQVRISIDGRPPEAVTVRAVADEFPPNAGFTFDVLLSFERRRALYSAGPDDWGAMVGATFVQLREPGDIGAVARATKRYRDRFNAATPNREIASFRFDNLVDPPFDAYTVRHRLVEAPHPVFIGMMAVIALFMMALACFNYVNIALGAAARRLQEVGTRKALGSTKRQLVVQFLTENVLLCGGSLLVGLLLAHAILIPLFNDLFVLQISLSFADNLALWGFLGGLLVVVAVVSGGYPAIYVASFQPIAIFRGEQRLDRKPWYTHAFLTFQFVLAFLAVIVGVLLALNGRYMSNLDWGYSAEQTLVVRLPGGDSGGDLRKAALQYASIKQVARARDHVGVSRSSTSLTVDGQSQKAFGYSVGPAYLEASGLRLHRGRFFGEERRGDATRGVVVNEAFVRSQGWANPVGKTIRTNDTTYRVIGVVGDFLHNALERPRPAYFLEGTRAPYQFLVVRFGKGGGKQALAAMRTLWEERMPEATFDYFFQETVFDENLRTYEHLTASVGYLAALALLIACMGLFGLASQNLSRRLKEVSIRKILGAPLASLIVRVNRHFLILLGIAAVIASAGSYLVLRTLLRAVPEYIAHMPLGPTPFLVAVAFVFGTAVVSVATHVYRLIDVDPARILRKE